MRKLSPKSVKEARDYLGSIYFHRKHVASLSNYAVEISDLTKKKTGPFVWSDDANKAFERLNNVFILAPILAFPDMESNEPLIVAVDVKDQIIQEN